MAYRGTVTLIAPGGEKTEWKVTADPIMKDGVCTFMQTVDGREMRVRLMGTVIVEVYDSLLDP